MPSSHGASALNLATGFLPAGCCKLSQLPDGLTRPCICWAGRAADAAGQALQQCSCLSERAEALALHGVQG